jgi:Tol biopolymer transport system component
MKAITITLFLIFFTLMCLGQNLTFDYFGITSPGEKIELFAPGIISLKDSREKSLAISPDGNEVFFTGGSVWPESKIMHVEKINNQWTKTEIAEFSMDCYATEPTFSPDGKYLFYSSSKGMKNINQYSIWRVEKVGNKWINPRKIIDITDSSMWEFHPTIAKDGTVYFCSWDSQKQTGSIYKSIYAEGNYLKPEKIHLPFDFQNSVTDPFIDPDGKYIITSTNSQYGKGGYDVYISYRSKEGLWLSPINFGDKFNTTGDEDSFDVSPDGEFIFIYKQDDVYWTDAKGVLENK